MYYNKVNFSKKKFEFFFNNLISLSFLIFTYFIKESILFLDIRFHLVKINNVLICTSYETL
jgi:hypothetical protein